MSIADLKVILEEEVREPFDHRQLEEDVPELRGRIPTSENLVRALWGRIGPRVAAAGEGGRYRLSRLRLFETESLFAEIDEISASREG